MTKLLLVLLFACSFTSAAVLRVGSGKTYSDIQSAVNDAACGDVVEITAGETFTLNLLPVVLLPHQSNCTKYTTIRSSACGQILGRRAGPSDISKMASLRTTSAPVAIIDLSQSSRGANFWRLQCLDVEFTESQDYFWLVNLVPYCPTVCPYGPGGEVPLSDFPDHIVIESSYLKTGHLNMGAGNDCVRANTGYLLLINNYFDGCGNSGGTEGHAFASYSSLGPHILINNHLDGGTICTLWGGAHGQEMGLHPSVTLESNDCYRPFARRVNSGSGAPGNPCLYGPEGGEYYNRTDTTQYYQCQSDFTWGAPAAGVSPQHVVYTKAGYELKNATRSKLFGNTVTNMYLPAYPDNSKSEAVRLNQVDGGLVGVDEAVISFVDIHHNKFVKTPTGVLHGSGYGNYYQVPHDLSFRHNLFLDTGASSIINYNGSESYRSVGISFSEQGRTTFDHNTFVSSPPSDVGFMADFPLLQKSRQLDANDNLFSFMSLGFYSEQGSGNLWGALFSGIVPSTFSWSRNAVVNINSCTNYSTDCVDINLRTDSVNGYPYVGTGLMACPSCFKLAAYSNVDFVNYQADGSGNYRLNTTSPLYKAGGMGLNIGADVDETEWATACAQSGCVNPYLDFGIKRMGIAATTVDLGYFAYNTEACTTTVGTDSDFVPASPTFQHTSSTGNRHRTESISGLSSNAMYYLTIDCGASHYQVKRVFQTR